MFSYLYQFIMVFIMTTTSLWCQRLENSLLFHINNNIDRLTIEKNSRGEIYTNSQQLNKFIRENNVEHLERWILFASENDVSNGIHLDKIYKIKNPCSQGFLFVVLFSLGKK